VWRKFVAIAPDPMTLNHRPAGRDWRLLILGGESIAADLELRGFQNMDRLAFRRKRLAEPPTMRASVSKRDRLLELRDRRKAQKFPFVGLAQQKAGQIIHVNPLHDDHDRAGALVVEAREQRIRKPLICRGPLCFRKGVVRFQRIVDDDDVAPAPGQRAAN
jgi:hypothetical protein